MGHLDLRSSIPAQPAAHPHVAPREAGDVDTLPPEQPRGVRRHHDGEIGLAVRAEIQEAAPAHHRRVDHGAFDELERAAEAVERSEEHTSELQSLMRISYAVFCLKTQIPPLASRYLISTRHHTNTTSDP